MPTLIRRILDSDIEGYHRCLDVVARERLYLAFLEAPPLEQSREFVNCLRLKGAPMYVAIENDQVVGWCDIIPHGSSATCHRGVLGIGVHPDFRGLGIGRKLMTAAIASAPRAGIEVIALTVRISNLPALQLYQSLGFVTEGTLHKSIKVDGHYHDCLAMRLDLVPEP